jgi:hypothetical protein
MEQYSEDDLQKIIESYKKTQARERRKYERRKQNPNFVIQNRERAKAWYEANKELKSKNYSDNKQFLNCRSLYNYYKRQNRIDQFIEKYPDKVSYLESQGCVVSSGGTTTSSVS